MKFFFLYPFCIGLVWLLVVPESLEAERRSFDPIANITSTPGGRVFYASVGVIFSGATSDPVTGSINQYEWYWREGTSGTFTFISNSSGESDIEFAFPLLPDGVNQQTYQVRLRVRNTSNNWDSEVITVTVKRYPDRVYFLKDHLGSVRTTVDEGGNVIGYDDYYPFGLVMPGNHSVNTANPKDDIKYTGYEHDDEANLNLYHANARGYDPILGRFGQIDPMMEFASPYVYVGNNPVNLVDPTGMSSCVGDIHNGVGGCPDEDAEAQAAYEKMWENNAFFNEVAGTNFSTGPASYIEQKPAEGEASGRCPDCESKNDEKFVDVTEKFNKQLEATRNNFKELSSYVEDLDISNWRKYGVKLLLFLKYTRTGAKYDIKQPGKGYSPDELGGNYAIYRGEKLRFDDFGNINFGVAALALGITLDHALMGAGGNQVWPGGGKPDFRNLKGSFDDPRDTEMIIRGYYHAFY